jgi:iron complex outermembrane recepter protein
MKLGNGGLNKYHTPLVILVFLAGTNLSGAMAQEVANIPPVETQPIWRSDLLENIARADDLSGVNRPIYDVKDFAQPTLSNDAVNPLKPVNSDTALAGLVNPSYRVEMFSPKAIAQAKKPEPPKPSDTAADDEELEEVNVNAKRRITPEKAETGATFTIKREDLTALNVQTVSEALTKIAPGFFAIDSLGGINTDQGVFLRGLGSNRFLVLIDGRPTTRPSNNRSIDLGRVGVSNIERIELITGGAGLRYGAGAIAGAINIITRVPQGPATLELNVQGGSFGFSRQTVNFTGSNGIAPLKPGYIGYELSYERRSALNNYTGTVYQQPIGLGISGGGTNINGSFPASAPFVLSGASGDLDRYYQVPFSYQTTLNAGYVFSNDYAAKIVYQPTLDHTLRASFSYRNIRSGDQFASANNQNCLVLPPNYGVSPEITGPLIAPDPKIPGYLRCNLNPVSFGRGDQAEDSFSGSLSWDWKLTEASKFTFIGSFASSFEDNPSSPGTRLASSQIIDVQLNYSSELASNNSLNAGFEYFQQRYNTTPLPGSGGNQLLQRRNEFGALAQPPYFALDITKSSTAFYGTDKWRFFDDAVIIDLGARVTTDQFFGTYATPGAGIRWNFGGPKNQEIFGLKASWFQSFRAPGLADIYGYSGYNISQVSTDGGPGNVLRNLALQPETGVNYDIGLEVRLSPTMLFKVDYFRTDLNNAIVGNVPIQTLDRTILFNLPPGSPSLGTLNSSVSIDAATKAELVPLGYVDNPKFTLIPKPGSPPGSSQLFQVSRYSQKQLDTPNLFEICGESGGTKPRVNGQSTCVNNLISNINAQSFLSTGWEFSFRWEFAPRFEFTASYSLVDTRAIGDSSLNTYRDTTTGTDIPLGSGGVQGGYFYNYQSLDVPYSTGNIGLRYSSAGFRVALNGLFVGLRPRAFGGNNYYEPYSRWDINIGVPISEEVTLTAGVSNLFNDRSILADSGLAIGSGIPQAPTTFRLGAEMVFK